MNRTTITIFLVPVLLVLTSCSRPKQEEAATEHHHAEHAAHGEAEDGQAVLHIEKLMLRDLRTTTAPVERRSSGADIEMMGELHVNENAYAEVGSSIVSRIVSVAAAPGQRVSSGQLLATLQSPEVGKARSELLTAQARVQLANRVVERKRRLGTERIVAERQVQEAEADLLSAEAELRAARDTLQSLGIEADDASAMEGPQFALRSPIAGTVIERNAVQGRMTEPAQPLFRIGNLGYLWLTVHAFERDAVRVRTGETATVTFPALPGRSFTGKVTLVGRQVDPESRTIPVRVELANKGGLLRPGMSATAFLKAGDGRGAVLAVPAASLQRVSGQWVVFLPRDEDSFDIRAVGRGRDLAGEVEILSGLKQGETVVVDGAFLLKAQAERSRGEGAAHEH
jgi:cobalt-zinc-cadmium efflux system membrane fusion protein